MGIIFGHVYICISPIGIPDLTAGGHTVHVRFEFPAGGRGLNMRRPRRQLLQLFPLQPSHASTSLQWSVGSVSRTNEHAVEGWRDVSDSVPANPVRSHGTTDTDQGPQSTGSGFTSCLWMCFLFCDQLLRRRKGMLGTLFGTNQQRVSSTVEGIFTSISVVLLSWHQDLDRTSPPTQGSSV